MGVTKSYKDIKAELIKTAVAAFEISSYVDKNFSQLRTKEITPSMANAYSNTSVALLSLQRALLETASQLFVPHEQPGPAKILIRLPQNELKSDALDPLLEKIWIFNKFVSSEDSIFKAAVKLSSLASPMLEYAMLKNDMELGNKLILSIDTLLDIIHKHGTGVGYARLNDEIGISNIIDKLIRVSESEAAWSRKLIDNRETAQRALRSITAAVDRLKRAGLGTSGDSRLLVSHLRFRVEDTGHQIALGQKAYVKTHKRLEEKLKAAADKLSVLNPRMMLNDGIKFTLITIAAADSVLNAMSKFVNWIPDQAAIFGSVTALTLNAIFITAAFVSMLTELKIFVKRVWLQISTRKRASIEYGQYKASDIGPSKHQTEDNPAAPYIAELIERYWNN